MSDDVEIPGYHVLRTLGVGGMATVYLAEQKSLEREVALKVMAPTLAANADFCQQFLKEGRITAKLSHPNLVTVHDIGSYRGTYYMASEYLPAGSLRERLGGGMAIAEALNTARDLASGLNYAHEMGFVHRDVKPGNILFRANGSAVLADFGIAKAIKSISSVTMAGNAIGTPDYMSPEQAQATPVDGRTDLYSLGAVLYEMLCGRKPYTGNDPYTIALRHVTDPVPQLPEPLHWLQPLIDGTMAKDREQRFPTGNAFVAECIALLGQHPVVIPERDGARKFAKPLPSPVITEPKEGNAKELLDRFLAARRLLPVLGLAVVIVAGTWFWRSHSGMSSEPAKPDLSTGNSLPPPLSYPSTEPPSDPLAAAGLDRLDTPALLARASGHLDAGLKSDDGRHLSFPDGDNAIDLFREVLKREPGNAVAAQGLARIAAFFARGARSAFDRGLNTAADDLIEKGLRAAPEDKNLLKLKADLAARMAAQQG
jgi:serine/threonine-protein kinase PpkA